MSQDDTYDAPPERLDAEGPRGHTHSHGSYDTSRRLGLAFAVTSTVLVLEAVGGLLTGSIALLADAGHMLTDAGALGAALFAARASQRPRNARKSFGYGRIEILAALFNGLLLGGVSVAIAIESVERLGNPNDIDAVPMIGIAVIGLIANVISASFLSRGAHDNLNVRAAFLHVLGDLLGSVAAITAGVCVLVWNFTSADAIAGLLIAALLVVSAVRLVRESGHILLEGAPSHLDLNEIAERVNAIPGVVSIHDLHVWTVTSGFPSMSAHIDLESGVDPDEVRRRVHRMLHQEYQIGHTTIQTERPALLKIESPPAESG